MKKHEKDKLRNILFNKKKGMSLGAKKQEKNWANERLIVIIIFNGFWLEIIGSKITNEQKDRIYLN